MFYTTIKSKIRNNCFNPKLYNPRKNLKKFQLSKKDHFKQLKNPQMSHINLSLIKKETKKLRNNLLPYYPKEHALRELTQLYFTGPHIIENTTGKNMQQKNSTYLSQSPDVSAQDIRRTPQTIKSEINQEKIIKPLIHNLRYLEKWNFKNLHD